MARSRISLIIPICLVLFWYFATSSATADEFRIDTMVFSDGSKDAICKTVTLVTENRIYDHLSDDRDEVTVIDPIQRSIVLLDIGRKRRTELSFDDVAQFVRDASLAAKSSPAFVSFAANPRFETSDDHNGTVLLLKGTGMSYRAETHHAPNERVSAQLRDFMDWSARLNTLRPGLPPAARLELNQKLFQRRRIPSFVTCEIVLDATRKKILTSQHEYSWRLAGPDRARVAQYDRFIRDFPSVDALTIWRAPAAADVVDTE